MKSNFTIKVSKTWRSSKFLMIWVCVWNFQINTNNLSFGVYAIQCLESTIQDGQPDEDAGKRTSYSPVKVGIGAEYGNILSHLCHELIIRNFENFKTCRKFQKDPTKVSQIQVIWRGSMVKPLSQFWISQIGWGFRIQQTLGQCPKSHPLPFWRHPNWPKVVT